MLKTADAKEMCADMQHVQRRFDTHTLLDLGLCRLLQRVHGHVDCRL